MQFDASQPAISADGIPDWFTETDRPVLEVGIDDVGPVTTKVLLDGEPVETVPTETGVRLRTGRLAQGTHTLAVTARDGAGNTSSFDRTFGVDSTERLTNDLTLMPGAKGRDVARLTRRLRLEGHYTGKPRWVYDDVVEQAVRKYQSAADLPVDGIVRPALLQQTAGRIVIDQSDYTLKFFLDGRLVKTYPIAVGTSSYPTPNGVFAVTEMLRNPTWFPPNSPWAAGLEPVPPGASNPLGTRWIGTSAPLIGIHGTPQAWSIRSRASHGCIRMYIGDVEELFEQVLLGMPVEIKP
jgi:murein L,D-transpeptidase YcbB/YkuD